MAISHLYPTQRPALDLNFARQKRLDSRVTFTRGSTATYVGSDGLIKTAAANKARFDHDPVTGESLGLLIEESRTNYIDESVDLTDTGTWFNYKFNTPTLNAGTAPDGTNTATSLVPNTENFARTFSCTNISTTFQGTLTVSVFAKANGYNIFKLFIDGASAGGAFGGDATFDLSTGTVTQGTSGVGTITAYPNGWYKCVVTHTNTAQAFSVWPGLQGYDNSGNSVWTGDGTSGYLLWGAQLEAGAFPTSYIPTSGSTVTRSADLASMTGTNFSSWYNQTEGSFVLSENNSFGGGLAKRFELNQSSSPNTNSIAFTVNYGSGTRISARDSNAPSTMDITLTNVWTSGGTHKYGYGLQTNNTVVVSGSNIATDSSCTLPPNLDALDFGAPFRASALSNSGEKFIISRLTYYPTRLSNDQLQALTL